MLYDCLVSCWAQEYTNRPSAEELTNLMVPENLSIVNSYNLGDLQVTDVLVVTAEDGSISLWIASNLFNTDRDIEENVLSVYTVVDSESGPSFKMDVSLLLCKYNSIIIKLCHRTFELQYNSCCIHFQIVLTACTTVLVVGDLTTIGPWRFIIFMI